MNSLLLVASLLSGCISFVLATVVFFAGKRLSDHLGFTLFAFAMGIWAVFISLFLYATDYSFAMLYAQIYYIAALLLIYGFLLFSISFMTSLKSEKIDKRIVLLLLLPIVATIIMICIPGLLITGVILGGGNSVVLNMPLYWLYSLMFVAYSVLSFVALIYKLTHSKTNRRFSQLRLMTISMIISLPAGAYFNLFLPLIGNYSLIMIGPLFILPVALTTFYAIMRHSLFDIKLVVVRTLTYGLLLMTLAFLYYILAYIVSEAFLQSVVTPRQNPLSVALALILAFMFQPIRRFFERATDHIFYRDNYDKDEFFARLGKLLSSTTDLYKLLQYAATEIGNTLKSDQAFFVVYRGDSHPMSAGTSGHTHFPAENMRRLNVYVRDYGQQVIITQILSESDGIHQTLEEHNIALVLPLLREDGVAGYLFLGDSRRDSYTRRDVGVLGTIQDELVIAIQKALSVQELKELNATLNQRVEEATKELRASNLQLQRLDEAKDEFVSMASHQLRTPLTSVKGYISMVLEGDVGKITSTQRKLLGEAFISSERMVHLINDFLNVSRLQTGKFVLDRRQVDLAKVVDQEIDSLRRTAESHDLKLHYHKPSRLPILYVDEGKIRQVIMNFVDNAIFYSHEGSTIGVALSVQDGNVLLTVKDTGIGVPLAEQKHLFGKFFRASNARTQRPDGTGVGLFLAKKVIVAHGGTIVFESTEGKGSTFGFWLPIKKLSEPPLEESQ